jgi:Type IV secretion system pilin
MTFKDFITGIIGILNTVIVPVIFALAFVTFVWGVMNYFIFNGGNEEKRSEGRQFVFWGILGMAVLFSVWGFVNLLLSTLGITPGA